MKYIIMPILRCVVIIFHYLIQQPYMIIVCTIGSLWEWDFHLFSEWWAEPFYIEEKPLFKGAEYYSYKTAIDYLRKRKTYHTTKHGIGFDVDSQTITND